MQKIIKKLNKHNINFTLNNNILQFQINGNNYSIQPTKYKNIYLFKNIADSFYITYKNLIKSLNKYRINKVY